MELPGTNILANYDKVSTDDAVQLYRDMLYSRMIEEKMLNLLRQGRISKWFSGIGQEAISVGITRAVKENEFLFPLHRNLGVFLCRNVPLTRLIAQWQGKTSGFTQGRDRSFHFGSMAHHLVGMISHLGPQMTVANGVALAHLLDNDPRIVVAFTGEGGTSEGDFHEALNVASVWQLPVVFVIENNGYALSTPTEEQYYVKDLAERGKGYGVKSFVLDGNDALGIFSFIRHWSEQIRERPEPILLECKTFRMRGHEEASGTRYVPSQLLEEWAKKDPVTRLETNLLKSGIISEEEVSDWREKFRVQIEAGLEEAFDSPDPIADMEKELSEVFAPGPKVTLPSHLSLGNRNLRFVDAISEGLDQTMAHNPDLVMMGQDIGAYGGVFKVTAGLQEKYGAERVRNTPLCESAIIGAGMGLSLAGHPTMIEMQFADFVSCGFNQIVNNLAKLHYRWGQGVNVTIRMPCGGGVGAGPFHSQNPEAWFFHVPGLKIIYPSSAYDAKGLLIASFNDPNPVLFFEHKFLYRSVSDPVPVEYYQLPLGQARYIREGEDASILTYGLGVLWAQEVADELDASVDIVDLKSLCPLDRDMIGSSVKKTGKVLILHEANFTGGVGAELAALIGEDYFEYLDAPVTRCAGLDIPVPFARQLEQLYLAKNRLKLDLEKLLKY